MSIKVFMLVYIGEDGGVKDRILAPDALSPEYDATAVIASAVAPEKQTEDLVADLKNEPHVAAVFAGLIDVSNPHDFLTQYTGLVGFEKGRLFWMEMKHDFSRENTIAMYSKCMEQANSYGAWDKLIPKH